MVGALIKIKNSPLIRESISGQYGIVLEQKLHKKDILYVILFADGRKILINEFWTTRHNGNNSRTKN